MVQNLIVIVPAIAEIPTGPDNSAAWYTNHIVNPTDHLATIVCPVRLMLGKDSPIL